MAAITKYYYHFSIQDKKVEITKSQFLAHQLGDVLCKTINGERNCGCVVRERRHDIDNNRWILFIK